MRFGEFKPGPAKPIGEGKEKKVYVNPENPDRVVAEIKNPKEIEFKADDPIPYSPRQLKGAFYLTKIAHLLLPKNVPEIYQAGESAQGQQTMDAERIAHTPGQEALQIAYKLGADAKAAAEVFKGKEIDPETLDALQKAYKLGEDAKAEADALINKEMGPEIIETTDKLVRLGLGNMLESETDSGGYTKNEGGEVQYIKPLMPWEVIKTAGRHQLTLQFDEKTLTRAINRKLKESKDGTIRGAREECLSYLDRIKELFAEDVQAYAAFDQENLKDPEQGIEDIEFLFRAFRQANNLEMLSTITDAKVALVSPERIAAKSQLLGIWQAMQELQNTTKVTQEQYVELDKKYKDLSRRAIGIMRGAIVDHS